MTSSTLTTSWVEPFPGLELVSGSGLQVQGHLVDEEGQKLDFEKNFCDQDGKVFTRYRRPSGYFVDIPRPEALYVWKGIKPEKHEKHKNAIVMMFDEMKILLSRILKRQPGESRGLVDGSPAALEFFMSLSPWCPIFRNIQQCVMIGNFKEIINCDHCVIVPWSGECPGDDELTIVGHNLVFVMPGTRVKITGRRNRVWRDSQHSHLVIDPEDWTEFLDLHPKSQSEFASEVEDWRGNILMEQTTAQRLRGSF